MKRARESFSVERSADGVVRATLCRPKLLNRFDDVLHGELIEFLEEIAADPEVRAVVLASTGRVFSAGGDFELMREARREPAVRQRIVADAMRLLGALIDLPQPLVAAVQGPAVGLGATVALTADAVVAARGAALSDPHVKVGLAAGDGGCLVWPAAAGMLRARRHLLTGDELGAEDAFALGLVTDLVDEAEDVLPAATALAERIAALPPLAVRGTKAALSEVTRRRFDEVQKLAVASEERTLASDDLLEAIAAFEERRPGRFAGR